MTRAERVAELQQMHAEAEREWRTSMWLTENDHWRRIMLECEAEIRGLTFSDGASGPDEAAE